MKSSNKRKKDIEQTEKFLEEIIKENDFEKKYNNRFQKFLFVMLIFLSLLSFVTFFIEKKYELFTPKIESIEIVNYDKENDKLKIQINTSSKLNFNNVECYFYDLDNKYIDKVSNLNNKCIIELDNNDYYVSLNRNKIKITKDYLLSDNVENTLEVTSEDKKIYLAVKDTYKTSFNIISIGNKEKLVYESLDSSIATIDEDGVIKGIKSGETTVLAKDKYGNEAKIEVVVSNLITKKTINNKKSFLPCKKYTTKEAKVLDEILADRVAKAGLKTRAGVVAAARFLSLEFPYKIGYFLENGRLNPTPGRPYADGEGRYYHKGLYLSTDKYSLIEKSSAGPAIWGCKIREFSMEDEEDPNDIVYRANGLDCSGYVTWAQKNGGYDFGDLGSVGWKYDGIKDLSWLGDHVEVSMDLFTNKKVKAGDLASEPGHVAIVIGIDYEKEKIYVAEEYYHSQGLTVVTLTFKELVNNKRYTHLTLMDEAYVEDGNYTDMW